MSVFDVVVEWRIWMEPPLSADSALLLVPVVFS